MTPDGAALYLGDELAAAAWRLAGLHTIVSEPGQETAALEQARAQAPWVLVSAACAGRIAAPVLARAMAAPTPLVVVVPDPQGRAPMPDLAARLRAQLGMAP
jgi:vacuolar-type H+-ATPase subunit F/Vma7